MQELEADILRLDAGCRGRGVVGVAGHEVGRSVGVVEHPLLNGFLPLGRRLAHDRLLPAFVW